MKPMDEDEKAAYRQEANEEEYNRNEQRKWARNAALHPHDPDKENYDEPEEVEEEE